MYQVRVVTLHGYLEQAEALGLDGHAMLESVGLHPDVLRDPENRVSAEAVSRLLDRSARESGCDSFSLLMSERRTFATLGPVAMLLERLPDLGTIFRTAIAYQRHFNDVMDLSLEESEGGYLLGLNLLPGPWSGQVADLTLCLGHRTLKAAAGGVWRPEVVFAARSAPSDTALWRRFFGAPVQFDAEFYGFQTSREVMNAPNPMADATMAAHAQRLLGLVQLEAPENDLAHRVRRAVALLVGDGRATVAEVAVRLGLSPRSLQRQLEREGTRFDALLEAVRRDLATSYLAGTRYRISTVAALVGYASPSAFSRWFAGAMGMSPVAWRRMHNAGG